MRTQVHLILLACLLAGCAATPTTRPDRSQQEREKQAKIARAVQQIQALEKAIATFRVNHGKPPKDLKQLLATDPQNKDAPYLNDPSEIIDPWGTPFDYDGTDGENPTLSCQLPSGEFISNRSVFAPPDGKKGEK